MKKIKLTQGQYALVDDEDFDYLNQWKWGYQKRGYAARKQHIEVRNGKQIIENILMHRVINKTPDNLQTDHINRNKLDNRKENLRAVTSRENILNTGLRVTNTSGFKGVSWNKARNKWDAYITKYYKRIHIGRYDSLQDAVNARKSYE